MTEVEKVAAGLSEAQRRALDYHARPSRGASCGDMGTDLSLVFAELADFDNGRLRLTDLGRAVRKHIEGGGR